jgi:acetamidase/formamidase
VDCIDWTGGQIKDNDCSDDIKNVDLSQVHYLSGPIEIPTAQPGDLLKVEFLNLGTLDGDEWGFTGTFAKENGGGFLTEHYPRASKAIWDIEGIYCSSRHIPGVRFAGLIHPGCIGTAPSHELLKMWNDRESALCEEEGTPAEKTLCGCLHTRPLACLPEAKGAMLGKLGHFKGKQGTDETWDKVAGEAARTVPGRENGGNCDIKNLSRGCTAYFPVFVPGANLSMGDMHFSQGDGEVSFCGAIEMSGFLELKCTVIKGGMELLPAVGPSPLSVNPMFEIGPLEPRYSEWLVFEGISVDEKGVQHYLGKLNDVKSLGEFDSCRVHSAHIFFPFLHQIRRLLTSAQSSMLSSIWPSLDTRKSRCTSCSLAFLARVASAALSTYPTPSALWRFPLPFLTRMFARLVRWINSNSLPLVSRCSTRMSAFLRKVELSRMILVSTEGIRRV